MLSVSSKSHLLIFLGCLAECISALCVYILICSLCLSCHLVLSWKEMAACLIVIHLCWASLCSFAHSQCGEGVDVGEGKQLLFLLFPWEVLCVSNSNARRQAGLLQQVFPSMNLIVGCPLVTTVCCLIKKGSIAECIFGIWKKNLTWMTDGFVCLFLGTLLNEWLPMPQ